MLLNLNWFLYYSNTTNIRALELGVTPVISIKKHRFNWRKYTAHFQCLSRFPGTWGRRVRSLPNWNCNGWLVSLFDHCGVEFFSCRGTHWSHCYPIEGVNIGVLVNRGHPQHNVGSEARRIWRSERCWCFVCGKCDDFDLRLRIELRTVRMSYAEPTKSRVLR
jgi:hypothetical protein